MSLRTRLWLIGTAGVVLAGVGTALAFGNDDRSGGIVFGPLPMLSFVMVGIFAWWRRPHNDFGRLMVLVGFVLFLSAPAGSDVPLLFSVGLLFNSLYLAAAIHMVLAFPSGHLQGRVERRLVVTAYGLLLVGNGVGVALDTDPDVRDREPDNVLALVHAPGVGDAILKGVLVLALVLTALLVRALLERRRAATRAGLRTIGPVLVPAFVFAAGLTVNVLCDLVGGPGWLDDGSGVVGVLGFIVLPYGFLVSLWRARWFRSGAVGKLVERLNDPAKRGDLRVVLADALGDPALTVAYWLPKDERYVGADGHPVAPPGPDGRSVLTEVRAAPGHRIGALIHDRALLEDPDLVAAAASAAALAMENERLTAALRARVEEVESSRRKLIEVGMAERRRLERDLHDGAQQRLVALSLQVGMARRRLGEDPEGADRLLVSASEELRLAQAELRELARGIHPAVLTDRGLSAAVETLAGRVGVPVDIAAMPDRRLSATAEAAAYFVVAESLTNVTKYAAASRARVSVARRDGHAVVEVSDDGIGGADPARGSGLRGLADRVAALDGRLEIRSVPGAGTTVRAEIPA